MNNKIRYKIIKKIQKSNDTFTLRLSPKESDFIAGQYITVFKPNSNTTEGKAYSISSKPSKEFIDITVKDIGEYSGYLTSLKEGKTIDGSKPYGYFYNEEEKPIVAIAGGIGITPFKSILFDYVENKFPFDLFLFHSSKTNDELVFKKCFDRLSGKTDKFKPFYFVTSESGEEGAYTGRMEIKNIIKNVPADSEFMICGSVSFVSGIWNGLRKEGVNEDRIMTESFFKQ